jgi:TonB-linked SusC/RagA family outer membrane protein
MKEKIKELCLKHLKPNRRRICAVSFMLLLWPVVAFSREAKINVSGQDKKHAVYGHVTDEADDPVVGANIREEGTVNEVITDMNGNFSINVSNANAVLVISYIGFCTQEIKLDGNNTVEIRLTEDVQALNEVVVVGYGTMDKKELTSAISHVASKDFLSVSAIDPLMLIQGKVSGVSITNTQSGDPNAGASIQIRGISSRSAGLGPLIVIDGVPGGNLHSLNSHDIESMDILKDGAASAIYGTRGSNGVIVVTTKKGAKDGKVVTEYNGYISFDVAHRDLEVLSADEFRKYKVDSGMAADYGASIDWMKEVTRTGFTQNHSLTVAGGTKATNYRLTADTRDAKGIDLRSDRLDYGARLALEHTTANGLFKITGNLTPRIIKRNNSDYDVFEQALTVNPTLPVKDASDETGKSYTLITDYGMWNPVEKLMTEKDYNEHQNLEWNITAQLNLLPLLAKGGYSAYALTTQVTIAQLFNGSHYFWFRPSYNTLSVNNGYSGEAKQQNDKNRNETLEWAAHYRFDQNGHSLGFMGGYSYQQFMNYGFSAENKNFTSDALTWDNLGDGVYMQGDGRNGMGSYRNSSKLIAFFGRFTYNYMQRYLLTASLRHEGSSKFGKNNKWGYFPAISAGWRISDEPFMRHSDRINDLKIRADLGITGNQNFDSYLSIATYAGYGDVYYNGQYYKGWSANRNPNRDLRWEKGVNWNIGMDFTLFGIISGSLNYYNRKQQDLLGSYDVSLPPYLWDTMFVNVGSMRNTGFETDLNIRAVQTKDFSYSIGFAGAINKNKFLDFSNDVFKGKDYYELCSMEAPGSPGSLQRIEKGQPVGNFFTWRYAGVDENGNWLVYDKENEVIPVGQATLKDKSVTGNGLPKFTASLTNTFTYKKFDLALYFRGAFGFDIFNVHDMYYSLQGVYAPYNTQRKAFEKNAQITSGQNLLVDYFIEKGDYVKLDMLSLGYTLDLDNKWINKIRVYGTVRNLFTITAFSGIDPAQYPTNGLTPGTFNGNKSYYPSTTQFLLGAQIGF